MDLNKQKFDWGDDNLDDTEGLVENIHPEIPERTPGDPCYQGMLLGRYLYIPFKTPPNQFLIHIVYFAVLCLNGSMATQEISEVLSSRDIFTRRELVFDLHCKF